MASTIQTAIRLGVEGEGEVKQTFEDIGTSSDAATNRAVKNFERLTAVAQQAISAAQAAGQKAATAVGAVGSNVSVGSQQNAQVQAYNAFVADQQRKVEALRNAIDPLRVAQAAYDNELRIATGLFAQGAISQAEYDQSVALSNKTLLDAKARLHGAEEGMGNLGSAGLVAGHVVRAFTDSIAAGQSPIRAATMEIGRVTEGLSLWAIQSGKTEGFAGKLAGFMGGGWGLALQLGLAAIVPLIGELGHTDEAAAKAAEHGLAEFERRQQTMSRFIDETTGKLREQNRQLAAMQLGAYPAQIRAANTDAENNVGLAFAAARAKLAEAGSSRAGPRDAALSRAIADSGSNSAALQRNLSGLVAGGRGNLSDLLRTVTEYASKAAEGAQSVAKLKGQQEELNTAYRGGTVLTTSMIDRTVAQATATTALTKAQANLDAVKARGAGIDAMDAGPAKTAELAKYRSDLTAATNAVHAAEQAQKDARTATRDHAKEVNALEAAWTRTRGAIEAAIVSTNKAASSKINADFANDWKALLKGGNDNQAERQKPGLFALDQLAQQQAALKVSEAELDTIGMTAEKRQVALDLVRKTAELEANGVDLSGDAAKAILAGVSAQDALNERLRRAADAMSEVRDFGASFIDDLASGKNIASDLYQEFIKLAALNPLKNLLGGSHSTTLGDVVGGLSSLLGGTSAFSSLSSQTSSTLSSLNKSLSLSALGIGHNASGTQNWSGGLTWWQENGAEIADLPSGTRIYPAAESRRMMAAANDRSGDTHVHVYAQDAVLADTVRGWVRAGVEEASTRGAHGGAIIAENRAAKRARYRIPGR